MEGQRKPQCSEKSLIPSSCLSFQIFCPQEATLSGQCLLRPPEEVCRSLGSQPLTGRASGIVSFPKAFHSLNSHHCVEININHVYLLSESSQDKWNNFATLVLKCKRKKCFFPMKVSTTVCSLLPAKGLDK